MTSTGVPPFFNRTVGVAGGGSPGGGGGGGGEAATGTVTPETRVVSTLLFRGGASLLEAPLSKECASISGGEGSGSRGEGRLSMRGFVSRARGAPSMVLPWCPRWME